MLDWAPDVNLDPAVATDDDMPTESTAELDNFQLVIAAILAEASALQASDRTELAARVLALGGYESADGSVQDNDRARLALRIAARLSAN